MQIRGSLSDRTPGDLLETLHREKRTGALRFSSGAVRKDVWFEKGEIVSSGTSEPREFLGSYLIASGRISEKDFVRAYRTQLETKVLFGKVLVMFGLVSEREVEIALKGKTEETIWDVFLWREGEFGFDEGAQLPPQRLPLRVDLADLVREGERRVIEWGVIRQTFPHTNVEVKAKPAPKDDSIGPTEKRVLLLVRTGKPVPVVAIESRLSPFLFLRKLDELRKQGLVELVRVLDEIPEDAIRPLSEPGVAPAAAPASADLEELRSRVPVLKIGKKDLLSVKVSPEEGYLLSRIDGAFDAATVASLCPYREEIAYSLLTSLASRGIIELRKG